MEEPVPLNAPEPCGCDGDLHMFVDSDHAGNKLTRRSHTGFYYLFELLTYCLVFEETGYY